MIPSSSISDVVSVLIYPVVVYSSATCTRYLCHRLPLYRRSTACASPPYLVYTPVYTVLINSVSSSTVLFDAIGYISHIFNLNGSYKPNPEYFHWTDHCWTTAIIDLKTLTNIANLASTFSKQGQWNKSKEFV